MDESNLLLWVVGVTASAGVGVIGFLAKGWMARVQERLATAERDIVRAREDHVSRAELERALERIEGRHERALGEVSRRLDQVLIRLPPHHNGNGA